MNLFKKSIALVLVSVLIVVIAACNSSSNTTTGEKASVKQEPVKLTFMTTWSETDPFSSVHYKNAMEFQKANPDIKLDIQTTPYNDYQVKLVTAAAGNQLTDLILMVRGGSTLEQIARSGVLMPIDDIMDRWSEDFLPKALIQEYNVGGKQYGIPSEISYFSMVFYNKKILKDLGYSSFPKNYEEFKGLIKDLKAKNITPIAMGNFAKKVMLDSYLSQLNGRISGNDVYNQILSGNKKFTDPDFVSALEKITQLNDMGAFNVDHNNIDNVQATDLFLKGQTAMNIDGNWATKLIATKKTDSFELGISLFPLIDGNKVSVPAATNQGIVLNANMDKNKKKAAVKFLEFMYSKESYQNVIRFGNLVPAKIELPKDINPLFVEMTNALKDVKEIYRPFENVMPPTVATAAKNGLQGLTTKGGPGPDALAKTLQKELETSKQSK